MIRIALLVFLVVLVGSVLVLATIGALHIFRGRAVRRFATLGEEIASVSDPEFREEFQLHTNCRLSAGNEYEVLLNGDATLPRLWEDLSGAATSITIQQYYVQAGVVVDRLLEILCARAREGVRVLVLFDSVGVKGRFSPRLDELRAAGVQAAIYRPTRPSTFGRADSRLHSRGVVVDGRIGYTGGFGFSDVWLGNGGRSGEWRDTNVRFTGPAVLQLQAAFASVWAEATGTLIAGETFFPHLPDAEGEAPVAGLLHMPTGGGSTVGERFILRSFAGARERLYISNSYFVPDNDLVRLLVSLARAGVDVRILTANELTDLPITRWAGRSKYEWLLAGGVRIYEYQPAMMHAKVFVVDGRWSAIGAVNLDVRSMSLNEETSFVALDEALGSRMEAIFHDDLRRSREIALAAFARRGFLERVRERAAAVLTEVL